MSVGRPRRGPLTWFRHVRIFESVLEGFEEGALSPLAAPNFVSKEEKKKKKR